MFWVNKRLLRPSALVLINNDKLLCYLPISGNPFKIIITWINFWGCHGSSTNLFPGKSRKSSAHCSCINLFFINKLIHIRFIPFWMNIIKKKLWVCYGWVGIFSYTFIISFWERLLSIPIRKRLLFLGIGMTQYWPVWLNAWVFQNYESILINAP